MKKTMLLMVFLLALGSQAIARNFAELNLKIPANGHLKIVFDGQVIPSRDYVLSLNAVPAGKHHLQVFNVMRNYNSYNEEPLFIGEIFLPPNTVTNGLIRHNRFIIEEQYALNRPHHNGNHNGHHGVQQNNAPQYGSHFSTKPIQAYNPYNTQPQPTQCGFVPQPEVVEVFPMSDEAFFHLKNSIKSQWFSDGQMAVFNQAASSNYFTSIQVRELIGLFSFSGERLEIAKKAYTQTLDPENYFLVYESLEWNSSVQHLSNYIASL